jgi:hypothetical protein
MNGPWSKLSARDRRIVAIGGVVVALLLAWSLAWLPLADSRASLRTTAAANATALAWMRPASARLAAIVRCWRAWMRVRAWPDWAVAWSGSSRRTRSTCACN